MASFELMVRSGPVATTRSCKSVMRVIPDPARTSRYAGNGCSSDTPLRWLFDEGTPVVVQYAS